MKTTRLSEIKKDEIRAVEKYFNTSTRCLTEKDSTFRAAPAIMSVSEHVAHTAQTVDWFTNALTDPKGFDLNFEAHMAEVKKCVSLTDAREWFKNAIDRACETVGSMSDEELMKPLPPGPIMGGDPKVALIGAISDHTAHHRGALTVYSRLLGRVPEMPYAE